ncbi:MAG TPA: hypothetical protein PKD26_09950 [Pyrinomonadaceae bacterium]|nr:hypothetical protein [Pyrinomonadaceae bacterium]
MPLPWFKRIRKTGQLTVHNRAGDWSAAVNNAINSFNNLGLGVKLVPEKEEKSANIVVKLSNGNETYHYYGDVAKANFDAEKLHGHASTLVDGKRMEIFFAVVFLPGRVKGATIRQKEVITVHEFIHACGLNGLLPSGGKAPNDDHDSMGIMYPQMMVSGDGLIEYLHDKGAQPMTPIRVGPQTACKVRMLWGAEACKD